MSGDVGDPAANRWSPAQEPWFPWVVWLFGPACLGATTALCLARPVFTELPEGLPLGCAVVFSHLLSAVLFVWHVVVPGPHRRSGMFWLLAAYWLGLIGAVVLGMFVGGRDPVLSRIPFWLSLGAGLGAPLEGLRHWVWSQYGS